jgi:hypothetical protein
MVVAVLAAVTVMLLAAEPAGRLHRARIPLIVMLALSFLLLIGTTLIADGFGVHVPEGLHLRRHGLLGGRRGAEHAGPATPASAKRPVPARGWPSSLGIMSGKAGTRGRTRTDMPCGGGF